MISACRQDLSEVTKVLTKVNTFPRLARSAGSGSGSDQYDVARVY